MDSCSRCKYRYKRENEVPCVGCIHNAVDNFKPMTQGDKIRSMSDEELAIFLHDYAYDSNEDGMDIIFAWLKSEVGCE